MNASLLDLARANGIILEYHDIWGHPHQPTETILRGILDAIGVDAGSDEAVRASLAASAAAEWTRPLPAAIVVRDDEAPWRLELRVPADLPDGTVRWQLQEESGTIHEGCVTLHGLECTRTADIECGTYCVRTLPIDLVLPCGYHRLRLAIDGRPDVQSRFCVAPRRCYWPPALHGDGRVWGVAVQLYGVRSARNWGIGDYSDLATIVAQWGGCGAGVVGVNPLHASYPHNPAHSSPYSPSSRLFKNWIYIDVEACADFAGCDDARMLVASPAFQAKLHDLRAGDRVDYAGVGAAKRTVLEMLYRHFRAIHLAANDERAAAFRTFQSHGGPALRQHALFDALQEHLHRQDDSVWGWPAWPEAYRDPAAPVVASFCRENLDRVEFFEYLQWQADVQYAAAAHRSFEAGLGIGIYEDLAVSIDGGGAEAWANQDIYAVGASVGAPPDDFNLNGQDWGLPPIIPRRLQESEYAPFIDTLRANMRHSGALRIDHVMGLMRLFWVAPGCKATEGVYVRYPFADMLGLLALESQRNHCMVIGEDLGTVPDEVRHALFDAGVLSYRLLYFERRHGGEFTPPQDYPVQSIVAASTHDLPTLIGWWEGRDIALRTELDLFPSPGMRDAQIAARSEDRARLLRALEHQGMLPADVPNDPAGVPTITPPLSTGIHAYLASTPSKVMVAQLEDVTGAGDQSNLPGTTTQHPNWCRKLPIPLERFPTDASIVGLAQALARVRPKP